MIQSRYARELTAWVAAAPVDCKSYRTVLADLARFDLLEDGAFPKHATIAKRTGLGESTVRRAIYWLRDHGLIKVAKRCRANGSQTSNRYVLCIQNYPEPGAHPEAAAKAVSTPELFVVKSNTSLSGRRALRSRPKIKESPRKGCKRMLRSEPEAWGGSTVGAFGDKPSEPTSRRSKARVRSGNDEVDRSAPLTPAVFKPERSFIERTIREVSRAKARRTKPVEQWSISDLAHAWRERLWELGHKTDHGSLRALEKTFIKLKADGASNADIEAMSTTFFADPARWRGVPGHVIFRKFIAQRGTLQQTITEAPRTTSAVGGHYATRLTDANGVSLHAGSKLRIRAPRKDPS